MERPTPPPASDDLLLAKRHLMLIAERPSGGGPNLFQKHPVALVALAFAGGLLLMKTPLLGGMIKGTGKLSLRVIFDAVILQLLRMFTGGSPGPR